MLAYLSNVACMSLDFHVLKVVLESSVASIKEEKTSETYSVDEIESLDQEFRHTLAFLTDLPFQNPFFPFCSRHSPGGSKITLIFIRFWGIRV